MLTLVRDLQGVRVVYYWIKKTEFERVSPTLSSLEEAEEWWLRYLHDSYGKKNRRRSFIDRRHVSVKATSREKRNASSQNLGRRLGDKSVKVEIDLAKVKVAELRMLYTDRGILESDIDVEVLFETRTQSDTL